jgi:tryptophan 2,3-dioxygenase
MSGSLRYDGYLRLSQLLDQQHGTVPNAHDELLFIVSHQVYELWYKVMLFELADARDRMLKGDTRIPRTRLRRCHEIERLLPDQLRLLDTMTPLGFAEFRPALGTASGLQSTQFREVEFLSGLKDARWVDGARWLSERDRARLRRRLSEPTVWDGFLAVLANAGFDVSTRESRLAAYEQIARGGEGDGELWALSELGEALVDHDQAWSAWRARHALTAERQIGEAPGSAGTAGASYLWRRVPTRFYPELWHARQLFQAAGTDG